jgi:UDP-glucose 4-epimerase
VNALAQVLGGLAGINVQVERGPARAGDIRVSLGDPAKARAALGVRAEVSLKDGLARTRDWLLKS